ncbi:YggS family pyridoxal phosphate-dependent enzyme [Mycoplasma sp. P36-A1]|uniref:YggS family pyridoxal phosphate-dependent enzyme n=1 Tax=Mycoplasma sp. P36-A1 TaxID=3252900 RepID=UPI003C2CC9B1
MIKQLEEVRKNIELYKTVDDVVLVGVTKRQSMDDIKKLVSLGVSNLGENRPQELRDKYDLNEVDANWHMIGRLQANKIKYVIDRCVLIHSVDDEKLMKAINDEAFKKNKIMDILIQINPSEEESKQGVDKQGLADLVAFSKTLDNVNVVGCMCMAPLTDDKTIVNNTFALAKQWFDDYVDFKYLSMGMSHDYILALQNGSNMLRIGSLLFLED